MAMTPPHQDAAGHTRANRAGLSGQAGQGERKSEILNTNYETKKEIRNTKARNGRCGSTAIADAALGQTVLGGRLQFRASCAPENAPYRGPLLGGGGGGGRGRGPGGAGSIMLPSQCVQRCRGRSSQHVHQSRRAPGRGIFPEPPQSTHQFLMATDLVTRANPALFRRYSYAVSRGKSR